MLKKDNILVLYTVLSLIFLFITTSNFSLSQTMQNAGASDGYQYFLISKSAPFIAQDIQYIKGERFILPYLIGLISLFTGLDLFLTYKILSVVAFLYLIILFVQKMGTNLKMLKRHMKTSCDMSQMIIGNVEDYLLSILWLLPVMLSGVLYWRNKLLWGQKKPRDKKSA